MWVNTYFRHFKYEKESFNTNIRLINYDYLGCMKCFKNESIYEKKELEKAPEKIFRSAKRSLQS